MTKKLNGEYNDYKRVYLGIPRTTRGERPGSNVYL